MGERAAKAKLSCVPATQRWHLPMQIVRFEAFAGKCRGEIAPDVRVGREGRYRGAGRGARALGDYWTSFRMSSWGWGGVHSRVPTFLRSPANVFQLDQFHRCYG